VDDYEDGGGGGGGDGVEMNVWRMSTEKNLYFNEPPLGLSAVLPG
jgi:hypothetical protein